MNGEGLLKNIRGTKIVLYCAALALGCFGLCSCTSKTTVSPAGPSSGGSGGSGGSTTISLYGPEILAAIAMQGGVANVASVEIDTTTQAVTNAAITLTGPSLNMPVTFGYTVTSGSYYLAYYTSVVGWNYQANQKYTMTISYGGHTYQSTITSVGNVVFTPGSSNISISWQGGGNENTATAFCYTPAYYSYVYGPNITSSYSIAQSGLAGYTGGNYSINMNADETLTSAFSGGAYIGSSFTASDQESTTY